MLVVVLNLRLSERLHGIEPHGITARIRQGFVASVPGNYRRQGRPARHIGSENGREAEAIIATGDCRERNGLLIARASIADNLGLLQRRQGRASDEGQDAAGREAE